MFKVTLTGQNLKTVFIIWQIMVSLSTCLVYTELFNVVSYSGVKIYINIPNDINDKCQRIKSFTVNHTKWVNMESTVTYYHSDRHEHLLFVFANLTILNHTVLFANIIIILMNNANFDIFILIIVYWYIFW